MLDPEYVVLAAIVVDLVLIYWVIARVRHRRFIMRRCANR